MREISKVACLLLKTHYSCWFRSGSIHSDYIAYNLNSYNLNSLNLKTGIASPPVGVSAGPPTSWSGSIRQAIACIHSSLPKTKASFCFARFWMNLMANWSPSTPNGTRTCTSLRTHGPQPCLSTNFSTGVERSKLTIIPILGSKKREIVILTRLCLKLWVLWAG